MSFLKENEKNIIRALIYGFIAGFYFSILLVDPQATGHYYGSDEFNYILSIIRYSIMVSTVTTAVITLYLYLKDQDKAI